MTTAYQKSSQKIKEIDLNDKQLQQKTINALFLLASFGYAFFAFFMVDADISTRGWTQPEIAMRIPMDNWASYEHLLRVSPIQTKTFINVVIYLLGDWLSQTLFSQQKNKDVLDFDVSRTLRNGFIGLCFGPCVHAYYEWSDTILPMDVEEGLLLQNRVLKILMDQTLYLTIKCSIYISAVGLLAGESFSDVKENVKTRIGPICFTAWKFWPLVHCVTYGLIPARHRILWVNCVDLIWNAILATLAGSKDGGKEEGVLVDGVAVTVDTTPIISMAPSPADHNDGSEAETMLEPANFFFMDEDSSANVGENATVVQML